MIFRTDLHGPRQCYYCAEWVSGWRLHTDHVIPKSRGGSDLRSNVVPACNICNTIKGTRTIQEARDMLIQRRLEWPRFNRVQLIWLKNQGFDLSPLENGKLAFEEPWRPRNTEQPSPPLDTRRRA